MHKNIDITSFYQKANSEPLIILDVRDTDEYEMGHVPNAINIPLDSLPKHTPALNEDETYYIICKTGKRAEKACHFLSEHGFKAICVEDGTQNWPGQLEHSNDFTVLL
ncbi:MAG: rhodanese-like domain-containing protein [Ruoffia tabacinasalis]|uniref:rhodanese-like domain-containing protein n=1 Tax=unclassified Ruoffia TaxID=2862149 RepID=UPI000ECCC338|nr:rhodanese-like domain-containing protein [Aerococcaceae bacterium]